MKKQKIDFAKYADTHEETELIGADGTKIMVRDHIPYEDKKQMARELVERCVIIHDDSCCYESFEVYAEKIKAMLHYYTDVDVDDVEAEDAANFAINNGLLGQIRDVIHDDYMEAEDIFIALESGVMDTFTDDQSIRKALKTSFGFLFNGEDITESLAKAEMTKDTMFKALDALNRKEAEEQEKMNSGTLKVGGNILNFSRRE